MVSARRYLYSRLGLLGADWVMQIADFGLSHVLPPAAGTMMSDTFGSIAYSAPVRTLWPQRPGLCITCPPFGRPWPLMPWYRSCVHCSMVVAHVFAP